VSAILNAEGRPVRERYLLNLANDWAHQPRIMSTAAQFHGQAVYALGMKVWQAATEEAPALDDLSADAGRRAVPIEPEELKRFLCILLEHRLVRQQIAAFIEKAHKVPKARVMRELLDLGTELGMFEETDQPIGASA
jgi:hypothetical protein